MTLKLNLDIFGIQIDKNLSKTLLTQVVKYIHMALFWQSYAYSVNFSGL